MSAVPTPSMWNRTDRAGSATCRESRPSAPTGAFYLAGASLVPVVGLWSARVRGPIQPGAEKGENLFHLSGHADGALLAARVGSDVLEPLGHLPADGAAVFVYRHGPFLSISRSGWHELTFPISRLRHHHYNPLKPIPELQSCPRLVFSKSPRAACRYLSMTGSSIFFHPSEEWTLPGRRTAPSAIQAGIFSFLISGIQD